MWVHGDFGYPQKREFHWKGMFRHRVPADVRGPSVETIKEDIASRERKMTNRKIKHPKTKKRNKKEMNKKTTMKIVQNANDFKSKLFNILNKINIYIAKM